MKKTLVLSVCLLLAGGLYAQKQEAASPVFHLDGFDPETVTAFKTPKEGSETLIPWFQPDTVVCFKAAGTYGMFVYTQDERGNTVSEEALTYISADEWQPSQRILSSYSQWDLVDTTTMYYFFQRDGIFIPNARKISTYDKRGRATSLLNLTWDTQTEVWTKTSRYTYTYNNDNQLITTVQEEPDQLVMGGDVWKKVSKTDYGYDKQGRENRFEMYFWTGSEWFPLRGIYRTYNADGNLIVENGSIFNEISGVYGPTYRYNNFYNEDGNLTDRMVFYADSLGKFDTTLHEAHFYNEQGQETEQVTRIFDNGAGRMDNSSREFYFYNEKGLKDSVAHEAWESTGWWHTVSLRYFFNDEDICTSRIYYNLTSENFRTDKYEMEYNEYGDGTRSRCFTLKNEAWEPAERLDLEVKDRNGKEILRANWNALHEITVHYAFGEKTPPPPPDTTADPDTTIANERINLLLDAQVEVYPNPVSETLYIDIDGEGTYEITLANLAGTLVEKFRMEAGRKALNVSGYKGIHLLRVSKDGATALRKIMIL